MASQPRNLADNLTEMMKTSVPVMSSLMMWWEGHFISMPFFPTLPTLVLTMKKPQTTPDMDTLQGTWPIYFIFTKVMKDHWEVAMNQRSLGRQDNLMQCETLYQKGPEDEKEDISEKTNQL